MKKAKSLKGGDFMCCEPKWRHHSLMEFHSFGGCCMPHEHHHRTPEEEKEMLESYKRDLEDEISRTEARIKKIFK
jgi:hypothetical protein